MTRIIKDETVRDNTAEFKQSTGTLMYRSINVAKDYFYMLDVMSDEMSVETRAWKYSSYGGDSRDSGKSGRGRRL